MYRLLPAIVLLTLLPWTALAAPPSGSDAGDGSIDRQLDSLEAELAAEEETADEQTPNERPTDAKTAEEPAAQAPAPPEAPEESRQAQLGAADLLLMYWKPILCALIAGLVLGFLGVYVVARRIVFVSAALSQVSAFGITVGFFLAGAFALGEHSLLAELLPPLMAVVLAGLVVYVLALVGENPSFPRDAVLGVAFVLPMGLVLVVAPYITAEMHEVENILHGSAVAVSLPNLLAVSAAGLLILATQLVAFRGFVFASLDPTVAKTQGVPVAELDAVLFGSIALMTGLVTRAMGALPAFALTLLPALGALGLSGLRIGLARVFALAAIVGALSGAGGYLISSFVFTDWSVGASQTLLAATLAGLLRLVGRLSPASD